MSHLSHENQMLSSFSSFFYDQMIYHSFRKNKLLTRKPYFILQFTLSSEWFIIFFTKVIEYAFEINLCWLMIYCLSHRGYVNFFCNQMIYHSFHKNTSFFMIGLNKPLQFNLSSKWFITFLIRMSNVFLYVRQNFCDAF